MLLCNEVLRFALVPFACALRVRFARIDVATEPVPFDQIYSSKNTSIDSG